MMNWIYQAAVVPFLVGSIAFAGSQENADRVWIQYNLSSVYRAGMDSRVDKVKNLLKRELGLYTSRSLEIARMYVDAEDCVAVFKKVETTHTIHWSYSKLYDDCYRRKEMLAPSKYPKELMLKALDALKELDARGLVLMARGATTDARRDRTGVMSKETFVQIASEGLGDGLVGFGDVTYVSDGQTYQIHIDLAAAMDFLDFTDSYSPKTRQWTKKYPAGSLANAVIQRTNGLIATYEDADPSFPYASTIRWQITQKLDSIIQEAKRLGPSAEKLFAEARTKEIIDAFLFRYNR